MITGKRNPVNKVVMLAEKRADEWSELLTKVGAEKDRDAFTRLFHHFAPLLKGFLMKGSNIGHELAEELAQEAMIKVWRRADSFNSHKSQRVLGYIRLHVTVESIGVAKCAAKRDSRGRLYEPGDENPSQVSLAQLRNKSTVRESLKACRRSRWK